MKCEERKGVEIQEPLANFPPPEKWDHWEEYDAAQWPKRVKKSYSIVPTICFNCEAACGLLAYIDKETMRIRRFEGNPYHPGSRGRTCAKGPATLNQVYDPERILYPLRRAGKRGEGKWESVTWEEVLQDLGGRIRRALTEERGHEVIYHVGRPGHDGYVDRVLQAWGIDGHNSHTNICSSSARLGYALWHGYDRPSPDHASSRFILLLSSHLETGHYFNPHAQRIMEAKQNGAKLAVVDVRLSNTASMADYWLAPWPGTEAELLLSMAWVIIKEKSYDRDFLFRWVNWQEFLQEERPGEPKTFDRFLGVLEEVYRPHTPALAERECGVSASLIVEVAHQIARAGSGFASHIWRNAASGNLGGWQVARALEFLNVLTGSVGTVGGTSPHASNKFVPVPFLRAGPQNAWNEILWPREYPLAHHEMSFLLPHFLKEGRGKLDVYFTRVYNPVWTNPDGAAWIEMLRDEEKVGMHVCLTPTWSETAWFADYVLPMGVGAERHDLMSQETHAARWIGFRQPVLRVFMEKMGKKVERTYESNPGEVWEEDEFWIELSWRIDPDASLGIRRYFESPYRSGEKLTTEDYYRWIFENSVPGLPEKAQAEGLTPLAYMRKYGAFLVENDVYGTHETALSPKELEDSVVDPTTRIVWKHGDQVGIEIDGIAKVGFPTPSRKLEFFSKTLKEWGWAGEALPSYIRSHVHRSLLNREEDEFVLVPTFRLPTLVHTRSGNSKWLYEISHTNPVWIHTEDGAGLGVGTGDLVRVTTEIGYFVNRVWITEGIRPGVVACSHHLGRWRLQKEAGTDRWCSALVDFREESSGIWRMRQIEGVEPFKSDDPDSERIWWKESGVNQNLVFPVQPDPVSGMHCWHQKVKVERAHAEDRYGDIVVDTRKSFEVYRRWLKMTRPGPGPGNLRRPRWFQRPLRPHPQAYLFSRATAHGPRVIR